MIDRACVSHNPLLFCKVGLVLRFKPERVLELVFDRSLQQKNGKESIDKYPSDCANTSRRGKEKYL